MGLTAVVTGASYGVGRATARYFASQGYDVALIARSRGALRNAKREIEAMGRRALVCVADVSDPEAVEAAAAAAERELGPIDVWVNSAMVSVFGPVHELTPEEIRRVTEVTYLGSVYGTLAALRRMRERDRGVIVQVGSALAYRSIPLQSAYCAAKHAIHGFLESLRCELLHDKSGVRVTAVNLPAVNTPHFRVVRSKLPRLPRPVAPVYQPEVAARAIYESVSLKRRELNFGVMCSTAILAGNAAPGAVDRYLAATGYESQQTAERARRGRRDNLFKPPRGDPGAHGPFDEEAAWDSPHLSFELHRKGALLAAGALIALCLRSATTR